MTTTRLSCMAILGGLFLNAAVPNVAQADFQQGLVLLQQKYYNEAAAEFEKEAKSHKKVHKTWYYMGLSYLGAKKYSKAASSFQTALDLKPGTFDYQIHLAKSQLALKDYPTAATSFGKAYPLASDTDEKYDAAYFQGQCLMAQGKYAEAADSLKKAQNLKGSFKVSETLAKAEYKAGDFKSAAKAYEKASKYKSTFSVLQGATYCYLKLAYNADKAGDKKTGATHWASAATWAGKASAKKPTDVKMANMYANALFRSGKYEKSIGAYDKALKLSPNDCGLMTEKGLAQFKLKTYSGAEGTLNSAIACDSKNHSAYSYLGYTYNAMAKPKMKKGNANEDLDLLNASVDLRTKALENMQAAQKIKSSSSLKKAMGSVSANIKTTQDNIATILENRKNDSDYAEQKAAYDQREAQFNDYENKRNEWNDSQTNNEEGE